MPFKSIIAKLSSVDASEHISRHETGFENSHNLFSPPPPKGLNRQSRQIANSTTHTKGNIPKSQLFEEAQRNHIRTLLEDIRVDTSIAEDSDALWEWCDTIL
jgi:hypothetical protein